MKRSGLRLIPCAWCRNTSIAPARMSITPMWTLPRWTLTLTATRDAGGWAGVAAATIAVLRTGLATADHPQPRIAMKPLGKRRSFEQTHVRAVNNIHLSHGIRRYLAWDICAT